MDENALKEVRTFQNTRTSEEIAAIQKILREDFQCPENSTSKPSNWTYATNVFEILLQICDVFEHHDELPISINETKKVHIGIRKMIEYGLKPYLLGVATAIDSRLPYIIASSKVLLRIAGNKFFSIICTRSDQHLVYTDLLSSIFIIICYGGEEQKLQFVEHLIYIQSILSHADYFKVLFLIQGSIKSTPDILIQQMVHKQLMQQLMRSGSFSALCEALLPSITSLDQDEEIVKKRLHCCGAIASIVAKRGYKKQFYHQIIIEIHQHLLSYIRSSRSHQLYYTDVGVQCLSKLCSLNLAFISRDITDLLFGIFNNLATPNELITGAIVCEPNEFLEAIHLVHLTFCASGPSDQTLPSEYIKPFSIMLIQIYHVLYASTNKTLKNEILAIIVRCLLNREKNELNNIVEMVLYEEYDKSVRYIHSRLKMELVSNGESENISMKIVATGPNRDYRDNESDIDSFLRPSVSLVNVLKQCNHNILIYNVFLHLLQMFAESFGNVKEQNEPSSSELLGSEGELKRAIEIKFKRKYVVIHALNELILFEAFHGQFDENPLDIVLMLDKMLNQQIQRIELLLRSERKQLVEECEEVLIVILSIVGQLKSRVKNEQLISQLEQTLQKLRSVLQNDRMKTVLKKLDNVLDAQSENNGSSEYQIAREILCETHAEPYTKVYGIMNMMKLINARDSETCLNAHVVLAITMKLLKEEDSYVFLNCIKLLIVLFGILEETVLDTLIAEYHFDSDSDSVDIDFKLKIGEAIGKVTQGLGEMCYKYKTTLINCFLRGVYNLNNEFRTSNMSNLGVIMRVLSYQVHHFFQEVKIT